MHRSRGLLPSAVPSFTHVPHSPTRRLGVTPFTRSSELGRFVAEQWTGVWRSCGQRCRACGPGGDNADPALWTARASTVCGARLDTNPHPADQPRSSPGRPTCGRSLDNSQVPRLWTESSPHFCGERPRRGTYSNSAVAPGAASGRPWARWRGPIRRRTPREEARDALRREVSTTGGARSRSRAPPHAPRAGDPSGRGKTGRVRSASDVCGESRVHGGSCGHRGPVLGTLWRPAAVPERSHGRAPGCGAGPARAQPFLMRLVSSVTWL